MTQRVFTTFPQTSSTLLTAQTPEVGGSWTQRNVSSGGTTRNLNIPANSGYLTSVSGDGLLTNGATFGGADRYIEGSWIPRGASFYSHIIDWSAEGTFYQAVLDRYSNQVRVERGSAWSFTPLGTAHNETLLNGSTYKLRAERTTVGATTKIDLYLNDVLVVSNAVDSSPLSSGLVGVRMDGSELLYFDAGDITPPGAFLTGATLARTIAAGTLQAIASAFVSGATLRPSVAGGTIGPAPGVITSEPLRTNNGTLLASVALDYVDVYLEASGVFVGRFTGLSTNGSGVFTVTSALLTPGTAYKLDWRATGGQRRMPVATAA